MKGVRYYIKFALLILYSVIQLYPLYWLFTFSLKTNAEIYGQNILGLPHQWRWSNYLRVLQSSTIIRYFLNSVLYSAITLAVVAVVATMASYAISRMQWKLKGLAYSLFTIGIMIPTHAALLPLFQVISKLGLKGGYTGLLIPYIAFGIPMSVMIITGFFRTIPKELEEAAYMDGCGTFKTFFMIMVPMVKPSIATASIFTFLNTWNELLFANTLVDSNRFRTLPVGIMSFAGQYSTDWGLIGAGMVIATLPTIIIYTLLSNQVQNSLVVGAVKG